MTPRFAVRLLSCSILCLVSCHASPKATPTPAPGPAPVSQDPIAAERESLLLAMRQLIEGRESEPASTVFENVQVLTENVSAANLVNAMSFYGTALGVGCSHCHVVGQFASDENPKKAVAREMMRMNGVINGQLLKGMTGLRSANPSINCITCHRGQIVPARSLAPAR